MEMMQGSRFQIALGAALLALLAAVCLQQSPGWWRGALTRPQVDDYLARIERQVPLSAQMRADVLPRLRAFGAADDGKPVHMLNVMRYFDKVRPPPGQPEFDGTPAQANALYEDKVTRLLFDTMTYPAFAGNVSGRNLFGVERGQDAWSRVLVVRYPSRRAFFELLADPSYGPIAPYKLMSLDLLLVPTDSDLVIPDLRFVVGALGLVVFLAVGWRRAARALSPTLRSRTVKG
jgi:hypothetical protein